jgi:alpha-glucosidase (family GH31 glycosyl hydrolase)
MVAIVDPHVKRTDDYRIYTDAKELDVLVKRADGSEFEGWCWPGSSVWVDFFNPKSWDWWTRMFKMDVWTVSYTPLTNGEELTTQESASNLYIWNDMNEVSIDDYRKRHAADHSHPYSTAQRLQSQKIPSSTVAGRTEISTTSTECSSYA